MADIHVALKDGNSVASAIFESSTTPGVILRGQIDPLTGRILVDMAGSTGGTGTVYTVSGTINSVNRIFTIPVTVTSDFQLTLVNQPQMLNIDYTYVAGVGTTTITMTTAPDISLSGLGFQAFVIS